MTINTIPDIHQLIICANVFIRKDGKYLVIKRSSQKKYLPNTIHPIGGKVRLNENPFQAAIRKVQEEAGVIIKNIKLEAVSLEMHPKVPDMANWFIFHFSADYESGEIKKSDEGDLLLLSSEEFKKEKLFAPVRRICDHIFDPKDGTVFASFDLDPNLNITKEDIKVCVL
ncbi:hypothetical protein A2Z22_00630 [Candidatus Woesebacteria bacterium RBG_16_34_12]|uniref:Nudix hydrolase domain-containing protein n=1 Tax=Candidatus Woesebacteria bacterium RBG_16_34_12 TaxID=1802480 RepID=A0A1F7X8F1_9BACT|nr:MAG: hypothetical protein A2Z22_00630 [Candidatus Woesebacteria bacterium RBG_16_34_12]